MKRLGGRIALCALLLTCRAGWVQFGRQRYANRKGRASLQQRSIGLSQLRKQRRKRVSVWLL